jgi:hypothetical protein
MNKVLAAARVFEIGELSSWHVPSVGDNVSVAYRQFASDVDHFTMQVRLRHAPRNRQNSVGLDGNTKAKIHHFITQIRAEIEKADLPDPKREALYARLNAFAAEVDKTRTSLQAGMAVYIAICDGIGQGFEKLEPARKWVDSIATLLGRAKDVEDGLRPKLTSPPERKQIEAPRTKPARARQKASDLDDEIPF